ncbi:MAG TPA: hypothetical protein VM261_30720 [Kofleriaceae bacterium]|nr:hypothetical protein [Kofleriaceae bacterium]
MARRDLSRTVIEGGRRNFNKFKRRASHGIGRARAREWLDDVRVDRDVAEARVLRDRPDVGRDFYDKLAVIRSWMRAQCGRAWDDVFSELMTRFDPRTIAGQHIVFDHMLRDVRRAGDVSGWDGTRFEVGDDGILRWMGTLRDRHKKPKPPTWTEGRSAIKQAGRWWWVGDRLVGPCARVALCRYHHLFRGGVPHHYTRATRLVLMTPTEVGRLMSLPARIRDVVLWRADVVEPEDAVLALPP